VIKKLEVQTTGNYLVNVMFVPHQRQLFTDYH